LPVGWYFSGIIVAKGYFSGVFTGDKLQNPLKQRFFMER